MPIIASTFTINIRAFSNVFKSLSTLAITDSVTDLLNYNRVFEQLNNQNSAMSKSRCCLQGLSKSWSSSYHKQIACSVLRF